MSRATCLPDSRNEEHLAPEAFAAAYERIQTALGVRTQVELAGRLGIRQSSISDAKRRASIPDTWLTRLVVDYNLSPVWVLRGTGMRHIVLADAAPEALPVAQALARATGSELLAALAERLGCRLTPKGDAA